MRNDDCASGLHFYGGMTERILTIIYRRLASEIRELK